MESDLEKRPVQSNVFSIQEEDNAITKCQRQLCLLIYKVEKYLRGLDELEKVCEQVLEELKENKQKMREKYDILKQDAARERKLISALVEMKQKVRRMERENAVRSLEEKMSNATQNALRYTTVDQMWRYMKIGCGLVFYNMAAYGLFKITQLLFLNTYG